MDNLLGMSFAVWWRLLKENRFSIAPRYTNRAVMMTMASMLVSATRKVDARLERDEIANKIEIKEPVFILGHWRSGTTFLHSLLANDTHFSYPTVFQVMNPLTFLKNEDLVYRSWADRQFKRPMDNIVLEPTSPGEEEFAISSMCLRSPLIGWSFVHNASFYDRFITFRDASKQEIREWQDAILLFLKKVVYKRPGRLLLKSPPHTGRIRLLMKLFPDARFIAIHRNPFDVFQSTRKLYSAGIVHGYLQGPPDQAEIDETIFRRYNLMYDALIEDIPLIPNGRYCEVRLEELEKQPVEQIKRIYTELDLPGLSAAERTIREHLDSVATYQKNTYEAFSTELERRVVHEWQRSFDLWKYSTIYSV
jgi:omega-hydroxy-beta-dihydromenaquinone-9 sulfotransferase